MRIKNSNKIQIKKIKNKCPVCSKTKGWCKNINTNEVLYPIITENGDIENPTMVIIERRQLRRRYMPYYDDYKIICGILCCMLVSFMCYMFYISKGNILNRKRENYLLQN